MPVCGDFSGVSAAFQGLLARSVPAGAANGLERPRGSQAADERTTGNFRAQITRPGRGRRAPDRGAALLAMPATASAKAVPAPMNVTPFAGQFHTIIVAGSLGPGCFTRYLRGAVECA
jgi:hypothetical protein